MDAQATLLSLAASTTLRQGAFLLRSDPTLPAKEPSLLPALTLAAQDLIRSYLASSPTFPPKHTPFAPPASQPSTSTSLAAYLTSLPEDEVTLPAPPSSSASTPPNATSVSKDASLHQIKRDVERDSFTVNGGPLIKGSESTFTGVVSTLVESIRSTLRTSYPQEPPPHYLTTPPPSLPCARKCFAGAIARQVAGMLSMLPGVFLGWEVRAVGVWAARAASGYPYF